MFIFKTMKKCPKTLTFGYYVLMTNTPKFIVCPSCEGEGSHGPGFVYTSEDIDSDFDSRDDFMDHINDIRSGQFDTRCDYCKGTRVVPAVDEDGTSAEEAFRDYCEYVAEVNAELAFGC
jgi:hypothetical protein